jgi:hypothetical protein
MTEMTCTFIVNMTVALFMPIDELLHVDSQLAEQLYKQNAITVS